MEYENLVNGLFPLDEKLVRKKYHLRFSAQRGHQRCAFRHEKHDKKSQISGQIQGTWERPFPAGEEKAQSKNPKIFCAIPTG